MLGKLLADLLPQGVSVSSGMGSVIVSDVVMDSRLVRPGALFCALKGEKIDGRQFIIQAQLAGASAILCAKDDIIPDMSLTVLRTENPRLAVAQIASRFYDAQPPHMVAVTGTDGKTSTADFYRQFLHVLGKHSASIGTLGVYSGDGSKLVDGTHTTPDAVNLHKMLAQLVEKKVSHACMEASSHGLHQYRMHGVHLEAAAFTNIARDHMDYHKTDEAYLAAKSMLFSELLPAGKTAVLNADDAKFTMLKSLCASRKHKLLDFGFHADALKILSLTPNTQGQVMVCALLGKRYEVAIPLVGAFQAMNILAAMGLAMACGESVEDLVAVIPQLQGVAGRMQHVATHKNGAAIYIDYAHTPAALANILTTIRPHVENRLHVVFGCGGDRDVGKRPQMGQIANELADVIIVTDDNPRSEDPALIRKAILDACPNGKEVADRRDAIYAAAKGLGAGDVLVIAGKGHEKVQIKAGLETPFDDAEVARAAVGEMDA